MPRGTDRTYQLNLLKKYFIKIEMDEDGAGAGGYQWEKEYEKTWEVLEEDVTGSIKQSIDMVIRQNKRSKLKKKKSDVHLGMMRHMIVVLDLTKNMNEPDFRPTRHKCAIHVVEKFVMEYFDQNPISQLGLIAAVDKKAEKLSDLGGNPKGHLAALERARDMSATGVLSIVNCLQMAYSTLKNMPSHTSKEILFVMGSLTTVDPTCVTDTIRQLEEASIQCSVVSLSAEVHICKHICRQTGGALRVALNEDHLKELVFEHTLPPPAQSHLDSSLLRMGFPRQDNSVAMAICSCHGEYPDEDKPGYLCPQCRAKYCDLPVECKICGLVLVLAPHLARSYHHLFPVNPFEEINLKATDSKNCYACQAPLPSSVGYKCPDCSRVMCVDCDTLIHDTLHSCPGCVNLPQNSTAS